MDETLENYRRAARATDDPDLARVLTDEADALSRAIRRSRVAGCRYCDEHKPGEMMPPHDASTSCESGGRTHCSCDSCF